MIIPLCIVRSSLNGIHNYAFFAKNSLYNKNKAAQWDNRPLSFSLTGAKIECFFFPTKKTGKIQVK